MPIRFRCESCQAKVRVPEGSEGRKVKCPRCGLIQIVPQRVDASEPAAEQVKLAVGAEHSSIPSLGAVEQVSTAEVTDAFSQAQRTPAVTHLRLVHAPEPEAAAHRTEPADQPQRPAAVESPPSVEGYPSPEPTLFCPAPAEEPEPASLSIEASSAAEELLAVTAAMSEPAARTTNPPTDEPADVQEADEPAAACSAWASQADPVEVEEEPSRAAEVVAREISTAKRLAEAVKSVRATATKVRALPMNGSTPAASEPAPGASAPPEDIPAAQAPESVDDEPEPVEHHSRRARVRAVMNQIITLAKGSRRQAEETIEPTAFAAATAQEPSSPDESAEQFEFEEVPDEFQPQAGWFSRGLASWRQAAGRLPAAGGYFLMGALVWFFRGASLLYAGAAARAVVEAHRHGYSIGGILDVSLGGLVRVLMILCLAEALRAMRQVAINTHCGKVVTTTSALASGSGTAESHRHAAMRPKLVAMRSDRGIAPGSAYRRMRQAALR